MEVTVDTYNKSAAAALDDLNTPKEAHRLMIYVASKVAPKRAAWKWTKEHPDSGFAVNTILPATTLGPLLAPNDQPYTSTAGFVRAFYKGKANELFDWLEP
ncbi:hypothetical protein K469DRAFT_140433 [Zopfia rhizophila CBS 207.26]|uniref:NAD(P)-binding protein n=1 Tax=Zopfia rhizophila CBS 207.26 TaxID=1314779 RepID=A0A6A6E3T6_9PEZI|nr:hypothetical protein K469DRAFT_140433 [Zopfia rhizophila CBS 207.26]